MDTTITADRPSDFTLDASDEAALGRERPAGYVVVHNAGQVDARVAFFGARAGADGSRVGILGHFAAQREDAATRALDEACRALRAGGAEIAIGPMNGSTWERYRFVVSGDASPPFFLEPTNPPEWPLWWEHAGFARHARYVTMERTRLGEFDPRYERLSARRFAAGMRTVGVTPEGFEAALRRVYPLVVEAFARNLLYTSITEDELVAQYLPARALVDPSLCRIAEVDGEVAGFVFAYPDVLERMRGEKTRTIIIKTLAARANLGAAFSGIILTHEIERAAIAAGASRVLYALMSERADSSKLGALYGHTMREYALYARSL